MQIMFKYLGVQTNKREEGNSSLHHGGWRLPARIADSERGTSLSFDGGTRIDGHPIGIEGGREVTGVSERDREGLIMRKLALCYPLCFMFVGITLAAGAILQWMI